MKRFGILLALLLVVLAGCTVLSPVPTTKFKAKVAGQSFEWSNPKNTSMTNIVVEVGTNGTARLSIGLVTSVNDPLVVSNAFSGEAALLHEVGAQLNQAFANGAAAAGTIAGAAAKAP